MLKPSDVINEILSTMRQYGFTGKGTASLPVSAYQVLERLKYTQDPSNPQRNLRDRLIAERGMPGKSAGSSYSAAQVVSDALEMLERNGHIEITFHDCAGEMFFVNGAWVEPGYSGNVCARYRLL